ncbi:hypothetical protein Mapa_016187 [Marchantia paleacea]|nr:hypothetical protein Mapa_016187 [Marchantia paleacea]
MAGRRPSDSYVVSPSSQPFSSVPAEVLNEPDWPRTDAYGESQGYNTGPRFYSSPSASNSQPYQRQDSRGNSAFLNVLKERVQAVLDAQQNSSLRHSSVGNVSEPLVPEFHETPHGSHPGAGATMVPSLRNQPRDLQMLPLQTGAEPVVVDRGTNGGPRPASWEDFYSIDWMPKEFFLKFRQQVEGYQLGANFEFDGFKVNGCNTKIVFKPAKADRKWKFICEPKHGDLRLLTKKIPIGPLLNIQVGIGHDWINHTTGWKWKVTTSLGGDGASQIRHKTLLPLCPGIDFRVGWNAEYVLPDLHGALGTGDPMVGLNLGHLYASVERLEAIYTHMT